MSQAIPQKPTKRGYVDFLDNLSHQYTHVVGKIFVAASVIKVVFVKAKKTKTYTCGGMADFGLITLDLIVDAKLIILLLRVLLFNQLWNPENGPVLKADGER